MIRVCYLKNIYSIWDFRREIYQDRYDRYCVLRKQHFSLTSIENISSQNMFMVISHKKLVNSIN